MTTPVTCLWSFLFSLEEVWTEEYPGLPSHRKARAEMCECTLHGTHLEETQSELSPLHGGGKGKTWSSPSLQAKLGLGGSTDLVMFPWALQPVSTNMGNVRTLSTGQHLFGLHGGFCCFLRAGMPPACPSPQAQLHLSVPAPAATAQLCL